MDNRACEGADWPRSNMETKPMDIYEAGAVLILAMFFIADGLGVIR